VIQIARTCIADPSHDNLLFATIVSVAFHSLLRLGELVWPDAAALQDYCKVIMRNTVNPLPKGFDFFLPGHKADRFFEGSRVLFQEINSADDPCTLFAAYITARNQLFPFHPELWLRRNGRVPMRDWFTDRLHRHLPDPTIGGHSLHSGGTTNLANRGVPPYLIQSIGRWASDAWQVYIQKHPTLQAALLFGHDL